MARPRCSKPGHVHGRRQCQTCRDLRARSRREPGLIPVGFTVAQAAARLANETKKRRYGPTGITPEVSERFSRAITEKQQRRPRMRTCRRGHEKTPQTVRVKPPMKPGNRPRWECLLCSALKGGRRPESVSVNGVRTSVAHADRFYLETLRRFREVLRKTHPDTTGRSDAAFKDVNRRYQKFRAEQAKRYRALGLSVPKTRANTQVAA